MAQPASSSSAARPRRPPGWHVSDYLRALYKRRWVAVPGFLLVFLTGAIGTVRTVPVYEATTQVMIEKDARRATSLDTVLQDRESWYQDDFYPTQYRILQSRALAVRTARALATGPDENVPPASAWSFSLTGLASRGLAWGISLVSAPPVTPTSGDGPGGAGAGESAAVAAQADRILGGLTVTPIRNSRLVDVSFRSPDAGYAARAVNELAHQYILQSLEFRQAATSQTNAWLTTQLEEQRRKVEESDRRLQEFKEQNNAVSVDDKQNIVVQKLNALNEELVQARIARMDREASYTTLQALQQNGGPLDSFPAVMQSPVVQKLKTEIAALESERAKMSTQYGPAYQPMRDLMQQLATAQSDLDTEIDKVAGAVRAEYLAAVAKERSLQASLDQQERESLGLDRKMLDYAALEREATSNRQLYESLVTRAKETGAAEEYRGTSIQVIDAAQVPSYPVLPRTQRDLAVAGLGGLLLAFGLAFGLEYMDSRIRTPDEMRACLDVPFLGMIPTITGHGADETPLLQADAPASFTEAIRSVRTALLFSSADEGARSVVVTSTGPHEGKTLVSSSLAIALAQAGQRTIIVDADMRRPRMHEALDRPQEPGLSNVLVGETNLADAARTTAVPKLWFLASGHVPPNPAELLGSKRYAELLAHLLARFDWVVIDAPPVMPVTDAAVVANAASGVLFVVGSEMTPRQSAVAALEQLRAANARLIGAVLNRVDVHRHAYYYAPYYRKEYGKYYQRSAGGA